MFGKVMESEKYRANLRFGQGETREVPKTQVVAGTMTYPTRNPHQYFGKGLALSHEHSAGTISLNPRRLNFCYQFTVKTRQSVWL